ncbi:MAG: hypothetical protein QOH62_968 [Solirubrobacteraceae bacterium]|jgi:hypothetical protein|nr:hypothetical protein [Solirubrobacteraceae bacterium]
MAAVLELTGGPMIVVMLAAAAFGAAAGLASSFRAPGDPSDRRTVALFRAGLGAGFAACLYFGMLTFLRDGNLFLAILLLLLAGFLAFCLTQIRIREPDEMPDGGQARA